MFFAEIKSLLDSCSSVTVVLSRGSDDTLSVAVIPKVKDGQNAVLSTPLALTGTSVELDAEFAGLLTSYVGKRKSLAEQLEATQTILDAAKQDAVKKAVKGKSKSSPTIASSCAGSDDDDDDDNDDVSSPVVSETATGTPAAPAAPMADLWS